MEISYQELYQMNPYAIISVNERKNDIFYFVVGGRDMDVFLHFLASQSLKEIQ